MTDRLSISRTLRSRILAKVLGLVSAENPGGLDLGGGAPRQFLVEVDNALHRKRVRVGADRLNIAPSASQSSYRLNTLVRPGLRPARSLFPSHSMARPHPPTTATIATIEEHPVVMHIPWAMRPGEVYVSKAAAPRMGRARFTLGGMSVESPRRVTKLIVTVRPARSLSKNRIGGVDFVDGRLGVDRSLQLDLSRELWSLTMDGG